MSAGSGDVYEGVSFNGVRRVFKVLCHLAWCDGSVVDSERVYLEGWFGRMGIGPEEARALESEGKRVSKLGVGPRKSERKLLIDSMIDLAMADGILAAEEQERLVRFGKTVGLSEAMLAQRIHQRVIDSGKQLKPDS